MTPFNSKYKITQAFGVNADYYKQFGLSGHEGIDLIPTGSVWDVYSLTDGVVVNETDDPRSGAYGIWLTVWCPSKKIALQYCHLKENYVKSGDKVTQGQKLGVMGSTGNSTGPHLHLNQFNVDETGVRLNRNNGFNGGVDPLPLLESGATTELNTQAIIDELREARDRNWQLYQTQLAKNEELEKTLQNINIELNGTTAELQAFRGIIRHYASLLNCKESDTEKMAGEIKRLIDIETIYEASENTIKNLYTEIEGLKENELRLEDDLTRMADMKKEVDVQLATCITNNTTEGLSHYSWFERLLSLFRR